MPFAQETNPISLYPDGVPNAKKAPVDYIEKTVKENAVKMSMVTEPAITTFLPPKDKANGTAVIICPGGAYIFPAIEHEGYDMAKNFRNPALLLLF